VDCVSKEALAEYRETLKEREQLTSLDSFLTEGVQASTSTLEQTEKGQDTQNNSAEGTQAESKSSGEGSTVPGDPEEPPADCAVIDDPMKTKDTEAKHKARRPEDETEPPNKKFRISDDIHQYIPVNETNGSEYLSICTNSRVLEKPIPLRGQKRLCMCKRRYSFYIF
jgi:hypothetical protein